jgi:hypothetical protein
MFHKIMKQSYKIIRIWKSHSEKLKQIRKYKEYIVISNSYKISILLIFKYFKNFLAYA